MKLSEVNISGYDTILLDRDGTINRQRQGDYVKHWGEFEFLPDAIGAIVEMSRQAKHIFVVTNQRGIAKGVMTVQDLNDIHERMIRAVSDAGGRIDGVYFSAGLDDSDTTRKPNTGLWEQIKKEFPDVDPAKTIMIGDGDCDIEFARNCGIASARVEKQNVIFIKETTDS